MKQYITNHSFLFFILSQLLIFIFLGLSFFIKNQILVFIFYSLILILCFASYYHLYSICQQMTYHAQLETKNTLAKHQKDLQEKHLLVTKQNQEIMQLMKKEIYQKINSFKHIDVQNEDEAREFAKQLIHEYASLYQTDYCHNKIIDAILYNKVLLAQHYHIQTSVQVIVPETININPTDIMSVYTNMLDNAIEACLQVKEEDRYIEINSMVKSQYLIIEIKNSKSSDIHIDSKHLETTKKDTENHGLGTKIIQKTCLDYHGVFKIVDQGSYCESYATLQIPKEKKVS